MTLCSDDFSAGYVKRSKYPASVFTGLSSLYGAHTTKPARVGEGNIRTVTTLCNMGVSDAANVSEPSLINAASNESVTT